MNTTATVTKALGELAAGDTAAASRLLPLVYVELRALGGAWLARNRPDHTLQPTALVHEAYLRLVDQTNAEWGSRAHFMAVAAKAMRQILGAIAPVKAVPVTSTARAA